MSPAGKTTMESRLDIEFGNLAISEGFATPEQVHICQSVADAFGEECSRKSLDAIMIDRGYITPDQEAYLLRKMGITVISCPHCNKKFKEAVIDLQKVVDCKHCGKRFEREESCQVDTEQTSSICDKTLAASQQQICNLYIGKLLGGKYEILEKIAVGGWSTVYKAKRKLLNIDDIVAIKILHINLSDNSQDIKRFYNEAAAIRELHHPNAIHLYDFDRDANGTIYMAMEFVHGQNLKETIKNTRAFDVTRMLNIIFQICDVISAAHKHPKKIIHRDITPQNIMLSKVGDCDDFVKVLDFGIAKLRAHDTVSLTGSILGTPLYMAPEQWRGECDERTDIYSLGVIMYEMLTGKTPFSGDQITLMNKHLNKKPQPFRKLNNKLKIPKYLENIVFLCLEKNKDKRPQSIDELKSLLQKRKCSAKLKFANYSKSSALIIFFTSVPTALVFSLFFLPKEHKNTYVPSNIGYFSDTYNKTNKSQHDDNNKQIVHSKRPKAGRESQKDDNDKQIARSNSSEIPSGKDINKELQDTTDTAGNKTLAVPSYGINDSNSNQTDDDTMIHNNNYADKIVDNIQKHDINTGTRETTTKSGTKEIIIREIQSWLEEYKKAWGKENIEALRELGHISSEKEENKLRQLYLYVHDFKVSIRNVIIEVNDDNGQATVSFDRTDEWCDERGNRHKEVLPRVTKILYKENNEWKIVKRPDELAEQPEKYLKYRKILNNITTSYSNLKERINSRFLKQ